MGLLAVYTTVARRDDARRIATAAVERGLAACVQIEAIESVYRWQGALQRDREFRLMFKTTQARYPALEAALREMHPYTLPAIHAVAVVQADARYASWVVDAAMAGADGASR